MSAMALNIIANATIGWRSGVIVSGMESHSVHHRPHRRRQHDAAIGAAELQLGRPLWMRHQTHNVALPVTNAGNAVERSVRVPLGPDFAGGICVAEDDLAIRLE